MCLETFQYKNEALFANVSAVALVPIMSVNNTMPPPSMQTLLPRPATNEEVLQSGTNVEVLQSGTKDEVLQSGTNEVVLQSASSGGIDNMAFSDLCDEGFNETLLTLTARVITDHVGNDFVLSDPCDKVYRGGQHAQGFRQSLCCMYFHYFYIEQVVIQIYCIGHTITMKIVAETKTDLKYKKLNY